MVEDMGPFFLRENYKRQLKRMVRELKGLERKRNNEIKKGIVKKIGQTQAEIDGVVNRIRQIRAEMVLNERKLKTA